MPEYSAYLVYLNKFGKSISSLQEFEQRNQIFTAKAKEIKLLNTQLQTSKVGLNWFSDWTEAELKSVFYPNLPGGKLKSGHQTEQIDAEQTEVHESRRL